MAINDTNKSTTSAGRRFFFGTNVLVLIVLVLFIVVTVNWFGDRFNRRVDLASGDAGHRLSDRTKEILSRLDGEIHLTTVYTSDEPDTDRKKYLPRLQDLCDEIARHSKKAVVRHIHTGEEVADLRDRIQNNFGTVATEHEAVIQTNREFWNNLNQMISPARQQLDTALAGDSWLHGFTGLASFSVKLRRTLEDLEETRNEVEDLAGGEGIPRYQEANNKIKEANDKLKTVLEDTHKALKDLNQLADLLADQNSEFLKRTRQELAIGEKLAQNLVRSAGEVTSSEVPDDPRPVLQDFVKAANALVDWLTSETGRVTAFVETSPAIEQHPAWMIERPQGPIALRMSLPVALADTAEYLSQNAQAVRRFLSPDQNLATDRLQHMVRQVRQLAAQVQSQITNEWQSNLLAILDSGKNIDPASKSLLAAGTEGKLFRDVLDQLENINKQIEDLPKLELDDIAESLQEDNLVIIEYNKKVNVVEFDDVWPLADPMAGRFGLDEQEEDKPRVFDGDSAIGGALLSVASKQPFATVIIVGYETSPPPQARQMGQQGAVGRIPLNQLSTLKERLELANFAVKEWNLGGEGEAAEKPKPEDGTEPIYFFLPPGEAMQNPMMGRQPQQSFGEAELAKVREVLDSGANAIFLATWEMDQMASMFAPPTPPSYAYNELLESDFGVKVDPSYRLLRLVPDKHDVGQYAIDVQQISHMQLSSFTDHPIGKPLKARRMLMTDVCPVTLVKDASGNPKKIEGVTTETILAVPEGTRDLWAESNAGLRRIMFALRTGKKGGQFAKSPDTSWDPPFSVILAATKKLQSQADTPAETQPAGEDAKPPSQPRETRVVVMGIGPSIADYHIARRVPRFSGEGNRARFVTDPPPIENAELIVNTACWLSGNEKMIAAGPAEIPLIPVLAQGTTGKTFAITFVWAALVGIGGLVVMLVRRK